VPSLNNIFQVRFLSEYRLSFAATYDYLNGSNFKSQQYILTAPGINSAGIEYLGMGDSFASGQGAFNYISGTDTSVNTCHLSSLSYPFLLSSSLFDSGHSVACSGAKTRDIIELSDAYEGQVKDEFIKENRKNIGEIIQSYMPGYLVQNDFVDEHNPEAVTLSIGGNDIGFADIVKQCVMPKLKNTTCFPTYEDQQELVKRITGVENKLQTTYKTISGTGRRVYVIGYPQIVAENGNCAANVHLDDKEIKLFVGLTDMLNQIIERAAIKTGVTYVDVSDAFVGHRMCETKSSGVAVNGFTVGNDDGLTKFKFIGAESYHPNALGHELLKQAILGKTNNLKAPSSGLANSTVPDVLGTLPLSGAVRTGRPVYTTIAGSRLFPDTVTAGSPPHMIIDTETALLKPLSPVTLRVDENTIPSVLSSDLSGNLSASISVPGDISCGYHTVHAFGSNLLNQPVDISKVVYFENQNGDCEGAVSPCGPVLALGQDSDRDGIDDACDAHIADPPAAANYTVYLTSSSIHATKSLSAGDLTSVTASLSSSSLGEAGMVAQRQMLTAGSYRHLTELLSLLLIIFLASSALLFADRRRDC
jgi:lysophospholipase L1-like esterase